MEEIDMILEMAEDSMQKSLRYTSSELKKIRAGKANANMIDGISIEYYGVPTPISQASSVTTPDARTISIRPFEKSLLADIERALINANLGLAPTNDGEFVRLNLPPMTEERRFDLVKKVKVEMETARINVRKVRQESNDELKKLKNDGVSEDAVKIGEDRVQKLTDKYMVKVDEMLAAKEKDIMSV
ncbi:ribosome recycling factor [Arcticibacterium luteifluviistationis]|uniref:Ribosome-recycling factor n=1 Tax=Arcticibacterium luteifluviistationis TaxID=1784714 RepID=A0A2Z4GDR7_9BACT|nr:ribosome recycling factor [Arcticibacterium luteifluviistationis]AWV99257.1 ribosome recycling factor [Arcticibacterium luteifluviistationis]